jgi:hypothetical protein
MVEITKLTSSARSPPASLFTLAHSLHISVVVAKTSRMRVNGISHVLLSGLVRLGAGHFSIAESGIKYDVD